MQVKCKKVTRDEDGRVSCAIVVRNHTSKADTITQISLTGTRSCRPAADEDDEQSEACIESTPQVNVELPGRAAWEGMLTWDENAINRVQEQRSAMVIVEFAHSKPAFRGFRVPDVPRGKNGGGRFNQRMQNIGWPFMLLLMAYIVYSMAMQRQQREDIAESLQAMYVPSYPDGPMNSAESMMWRALYHAYVTDDMDAEQRVAAEARLRAVIAGEFSQNEAQSPEAVPNQDRTAAAGDTGVIDATRPSGRYAGLTDIERMLFDKGADTKGDELALVAASGEGTIDVVKRLLGQGADVDVKDNDGETALIAAAMRGRTDVVKLLLDKGADVHAVNNDGRTALMIASQAGHADIVKMLQK